MIDVPTKSLLVMFKPDGDSRSCTKDEVARIGNGWSDVLAWLRGADPDDLAHADLVEAVAQEAGLRLARSAEYDIQDWAAQAKTLGIPRPTTAPAADAPVLSEIVAAHLVNAGFAMKNTSRTWLNRVAIELLYRDAPTFDREVHVRRLLKRPVTIQQWHGERHGLGYALKLLTRRALSTSALTNLLHIESVTAGDAELVSRSLEMPL